MEAAEKQRRRKEGPSCSDRRVDSPFLSDPSSLERLKPQTSGTFNILIQAYPSVNGAYTPIKIP